MSIPLEDFPPVRSAPGVHLGPETITRPQLTANSEDFQILNESKVQKAWSMNGIRDPGISWQKVG